MNGTSPLSGNCGLVNDNFSNKAGCPSSVCLFDKSSNRLTLISFVRQHVFYKTQVNNRDVS